MTYVERTATEYNDGDDSPVHASRPISAYRSERAYVLLGDPGAGKTTVFEHEAKAHGVRPPVTAREFARGDLDNASDAKDTVLFIDGLDEWRAGDGNPRSRLDKIIARLRRLAYRRFRISCRPADWGLTDAKALRSLLDDGTSPSDGGRLPVLRLDPLGRDGVRHILGGLPAGQEMDPAGFVQEAVRRGLGGLLGNPQSLQLLTSVVATGSWPASRTELFEKACRQLVQERNPEHLDAALHDPSELDAEHLLDAAGRLAALFLLAGAQAICRSGAEQRDDDLALADVRDKNGLRRALASKFFTAQSPGRFVPVHLHIAEYVGARFLRNVIEGGTSAHGTGLPSTRVLALLTSHDGGLVPGLRGLAAWLAAHCGEARRALVSADPIAVLAYGDVAGFGGDDLDDLVRALEERTRRLWRQTPPAPVLGSMIRPSTIKMLRAYVAGDDRGDAKQAVVDLLLRGIPHAASVSGATFEERPEASPTFIGELLSLVRDRTWWPRVRHAGLMTALHISERSSKGDELVDEFLADVKDGRVHDPDNELRGRLLTALYPHRVSPESVWDYVPKVANRATIGHHYVFWLKRVEDKAPNPDVPVLLDGLLAWCSQILSVLDEDEIDDLLHRLLARVLYMGDKEIPVSRLSKWIELAVRTGTPGIGRRDTPERRSLQSWLGAHPETCKDCLLEFLERNAQANDLVFYAGEYRRKIFDGSLPSGFVAWCLDHAIAMARSHSPAAQLLLEWAASLQQSEPHFDRWVSSASARLDGFPELSNRLANLTEIPDPKVDDVMAIRRRQQEAIVARRKEFVAHVHAHAVDLAEGTCPVELVDDLAKAYFGFYAGYRSTEPVDSLRKYLDSDESLVSATLSGFNRMLDRDDLPSLHEIVQIDAKGHRSPFALPVLAALAEMDRTGCRVHRTLTDDGIRRAVGFYYVSPRPMVRDPHTGWYRPVDIPNWYDELVRSHAKLVSEGLVAVHKSKIRRKADCEEHLAPLAWEPKYRELAQLAVPLLFHALPVVCTRPQILALRQLLWASVRYMPDDLASCVDVKIARSGMDVAQRALWLAAGMLASPRRHLASAMDFIATSSPSPVQHLLDFVVLDQRPTFSMKWRTEHLAMMVRRVGARLEPWRPSLPNGDELTCMTPADDAAIKARRLLSACLDRLAKNPQAAAADALNGLVAAPELAAWRHDMLEARDQQAALRRVHLHKIPTLNEVQETLQNSLPANVADLLALLVDRLEQLATEIRNGNTDDWKQYWNVDSHGRPREEDTRPEFICRDALLSALRRHLPVAVDAQPEAQHAERKRSDIRVAYGGYAVPVEIKKNTHAELWSAIKTQLIAKYARALDSNEYGVYLVLWFGADYTTKVQPPTGRRPNTPDELRQQLEEQVPPDKRSKIKVVVVDVSRPEKSTA